MKSLYVLSALLFSAPLWSLTSQTIEGHSFPEALAKNLAEQIAKQSALPESQIKIELESLKLEPAIELGKVKSVQVLGLFGKRLDGLFQLPVVVQVGRLSQTFQVSGVMKINGPVLVAKRAMLRGEVIESQDLRSEILPWRTLPTGATGISEKELLGLRVKSHIERGSVVYPLLLDEPFAVKNGEMVELTLMSGPGVLIRSRAVAKQEGYVGDVIRLEQPDTRKALTGQIVGKKSVEVRL